MSRDDLIVRGIKGGVLILLPAARWYQQRDALISRIQTQEQFFKGGRIAIDVGEADWTEDQLVKLLRDLADEGVCLWAVLSISAVTLSAARSFGISTTIKTENPEDAEEQVELELSQSHWINREIEPGERLAVDGNAVILGDIPGDAEVIVSGSLVIWGSVAGTVCAVCSGNTEGKIRLLKYGGGTIFLAGVAVKIPRKMQKDSPMEICLQDGEIQILTNRVKKFRLL
ncbi:MAG: septum site-determining protein MinC [Anaerolineaceae bacterium]